VVLALDTWIRHSWTDVTTNLITAALSGILGWVLHGIYRRDKQFRARRFWRQIGVRGPVLVLGTHDPEALGEWERFGLVGYGDATALIEIQQQFRALGLKLTTTGAGILSQNEWRKDLILIGSPDANEATAEIMGELEPRLTYSFPYWKNHNVTIADKLSGDKIKPESGPGGQIKTDYALIIRAPNPLAPSDSEVVIIAGCWGYGTAAASSLLAEKRFYRDPVVSSRKPFEALVRVRVLGGSQYYAELKEARLLADQAGRSAK